MKQSVCGRNIPDECPVDCCLTYCKSSCCRYYYALAMESERLAKRCEEAIPEHLANAKMYRGFAKIAVENKEREYNAKQ